MKEFIQTINIGLILGFVCLSVVFAPSKVNATPGPGVCDCRVTVVSAFAGSQCEESATRSYPFNETVTLDSIARALISDTGCQHPPTLFDFLPAYAINTVKLDSQTCQIMKASGTFDDFSYNVQCLPATLDPQTSGLIEPCPNNPNLVPGEIGCRDANILLLQLIRIAEFLFSIIGSIAFLMFIYGGFSLIVSLGNAEKAKKAHATLFAAVVGLLIAFGSVILVDFILDVFGVQQEFRL